MDLEKLIEREVLNTAEALPCDFIEGQERDILRHFLSDRVDKLKPRTRELLQQWIYDNWNNHLKYKRVSSPFIRLAGYPIYTPFEIFIDLEQLPTGMDDNDYIVNGDQACINTGYDCLVVDFSDVNFAKLLQEIRR
jgi:hypothetical protein